MNKYLKAKVREIYVTGCKAEYEGSLTLDKKIMDKLGISPGEAVDINSKYKPVRITTYVIPGGDGQCELNGGAAQYLEKGDIVHLLFWTYSENPVKPVII